MLCLISFRHSPLQVLDDHLYSLLGHLDTAVAALNAVAAGRLPGLWLAAAAADCGPAAPCRVELQRVPMQVGACVVVWLHGHGRERCGGGGCKYLSKLGGGETLQELGNCRSTAPYNEAPLKSLQCSITRA